MFTSTNEPNWQADTVARFSASIINQLYQRLSEHGAPLASVDTDIAVDFSSTEVGRVISDGHTCFRRSPGLGKLEHGGRVLLAYLSAKPDSVSILRSGLYRLVSCHWGNGTGNHLNQIPHRLTRRRLPLEL